LRDLLKWASKTKAKTFGIALLRGRCLSSVSILKTAKKEKFFIGFENEKFEKYCRDAAVAGVF
jgi:hypothetical protein